MIGSANLSNRSMGFDTECNLAIESDSEQHADRPAADYRNRLLAEHLDQDLQTVETAIREKNGLIQAIRALSGKERTLEQLNDTGKPPVDIPELVRDRQLIDPETPLQLDRMMDEIAGEAGTNEKRGPLLKFTLILVFIIGLSAAWQWTPLSKWITMEQLVFWANTIRGQQFVLPIVLGAYIAGGLLVLPITLLISVTAIVFDTYTALFYAVGGSLANALTCYGIGILLGRRSLHMLSGKRLKQLNKHIRQYGILAVIMLRNIPVAPFSIVNFIAGASRIKLLDFAVGTVLGMLPGIVVITLFSRRVMHVLHNPDAVDIFLTILIGCIILGIGWGIQKRLSD